MEELSNDKCNKLWALSFDGWKQGESERCC